MKGLWFLLPLTCHFIGAWAQEEIERWPLSTGVKYGRYVNSPGVNLNVTYRVIGKFHIGRDFSALLTLERDENGKIVKQKELEYNLNAQNLFEMNKRLLVYPIAGIDWSKVTVHPQRGEANTTRFTALNAGGGLELQLKGVRLFLESKWVSRLNMIDITAGVLLSL